MFLFFFFLVISLASAKSIIYRPNNDLRGQNPNGPWSFGDVSPGDHLSFQKYTRHIPNVHHQSSPVYHFNIPTMAGVEAWFSGTHFNDSFIFHNTNINKVAVYAREYSMAPGQLLFHPGPTNTRACVRFTVPLADTYDIDAVFFTTSKPPTTFPTTDIHLSINDVDLRSLWQKRNTGRFVFNQIYLNEGDYVQFEVGFGENRNFYFDGVQLNITLTANSY